MDSVPDKAWTGLKKFSFRFIFIFLAYPVVQMFSRYFLGNGNMDFLYYPSFFLQNYVLKLHDTPVWTHVATGGADTLDDWVQQLGIFLLALIGAGIWTLLDKNRKDYNTLYLWTKTIVRYFLASVMILYGLNKLFMVQMGYPKLSYFYTPLGDFHPMDLAWTFVGYSPAYEFIGGLLEFTAAVLLFFRRTYLFGVLMFLGVMSNVLMLNYLYGVGVKTFSSLLFIMGIFLLAEYIPKLYDFLLLQKRVQLNIKGLQFNTPWKRKARKIFKIAYISIGIVGMVILHVRLYARVNNHSPIAIEGAYDIHTFEINGEANADYFDSSRWNQVVINRSQDGKTSSGHVSLGTTKRELATFTIDSLDQVTISFDRDSTVVFQGKHLKSDDTFIWSGILGRDSLQMILRQNTRKVPLRDRPFTLIVEPWEQENLRTRK